MKCFLPLLLVTLFVNSFSFAQAPLVKQWDHRYGSLKGDYLTCLIQTSDRGFLMCGLSEGDADGDRSENNRGRADFWVVKTDSLGIKQWDKRFGGDQDDWVRAVVETPDKGFILAGSSSSAVGGDKTEPIRGSKPYGDFWIVRIDSLGNKVWDKRYGGNLDDGAHTIKATRDGNYIVGGYSWSAKDGDRSQPGNGAYDYWLIKITPQGNKIWDRSYGGSGADFMKDVIQTPDGGFLMAGSSASDKGGYKSQNSRDSLTNNFDYWAIKTDSMGNKKWDITLGGIGNEQTYSVNETNDGGYVFVGYLTTLNINGDVTVVSNGFDDVWLVKVDSLGKKVWDRVFGGNNSEWEMGRAFKTHDGGLMITTGSISRNKSGTKSENNLGGYQGWIVKLDSLYNYQWDKTIFSNSFDSWSFGVPTHDGGYAVAVTSEADTGGYKSEFHRGGKDYWLVKFGDTSLCKAPVAGLVSASKDTVCMGKNSALTLSGGSGNIQWQSSTDGVTFTDIPGAGSAGYNAANLTKVMYYRTRNFNKCGTALSSIKKITVVPGPVAGLLSSSKDSICSGTGLTTTLTASGSAGVLRWQGSTDGTHFTDIAGATTTAYTTPPTLTQTMYYRIIANSGGGCAPDSSGIIAFHILPSPTAVFTEAISGKQVAFNSGGSSSDVAIYNWDFGDGGTSPQANPVHVYGTRDTFSVCLTVYNGSNCSFTFCKDVIINEEGSGILNSSGNSSIQLYPNPVVDELIINTEGIAGEYELKIYNVLGQEMAAQQVILSGKQSITLNLSSLAAGSYYLMLTDGDDYYNKRFVHIK